MRTVDVGTLKPLCGGGAGPWLMGGGRLLRISSGGRAIGTEAEARAMLAAYRAAAAAAGTPAGHEVVALEGGFGVVVDYVEGVGLGVHLGIGSFAPDEAGREMGALLRGLHGARMGDGRDWNATFRRWANDLAPLLPAEAGGRLVALVEAVPGSGRLLHGDFHVGNVVVGGGELRPVDLEGAGFGHPALDLAIARSRTLGDAAREAGRMGIDEAAAERVARGIWSGLLEGYFAGAGEGELERLDRRFEALSLLERCCFAYGAGRPASSGPEARRRPHAALHAKRLAQLLPRIDRLDF